MTFRRCVISICFFIVLTSLFSSGLNSQSRFSRHVPMNFDEIPLVQIPWDLIDQTLEYKQKQNLKACYDIILHTVINELSKDGSKFETFKPSSSWISFLLFVQLPNSYGIILLTTHDNHVYLFKNTNGLWNRWKNANSKGEFYNTYVRKNPVYSFEFDCTYGQEGLTKALLPSLKKNSPSTNRKATIQSSSRVNTAKLKNEPDALGEVIEYIPFNSKIKLVGYRKNGYWEVKYKNQTGYLNNIFFSKLNVENQSLYYDYLRYERNKKYSVSNKAPKSKITETQVKEYTPTVITYELDKPINKTGTIKSDAKLRIKPNSIASYNLVIPKGSKVLLQNFANSYWKVKYNSFEGYINEIYIEESISDFKKTTTEPTFANNNSSILGIRTVMRQDGNLWGDVNQSAWLGTIAKGTEVKVIGFSNSFWKVEVNSKIGFLNHSSVVVTREMLKFKE